MNCEQQNSSEPLLKQESRTLFTATPKDFVTTLPLHHFEGRIVVVQSKVEAEKAVKALKTQRILGIDTETKPSFRKGHTNQVALLQVCMRDVCFLFRLNEIGFLPCLQRLLGDKKICKVGLSLKDDALMLQRKEPSFKPAGFLDLQNFAAELGVKDKSLLKLYANVFHKRISKKMRLSNWEADVLTEPQKVYAATDASVCLDLFAELTRLKASGQYALIPEPVKEDVPLPDCDANEKEAMA